MHNNITLISIDTLSRQTPPDHYLVEKDNMEKTVHPVYTLHISNSITGFPGSYLVKLVGSLESMKEIHPLTMGFYGT